MASRLISLVITVLVVVGLAVPVAAQSPMPYPEYRKELDAAREAERMISESDTTTTTVDDLVTRLTSALARWDAEATRLEGIAPDACYAEAHAEYVSYTRDVVDTYRDTLPLIKDAKSVMGMLPMLLAANATVRAAHPLAYVEDSTASDGYRSEPMNIFEVLATCAPIASEAPSPVPSPTARAGSPAPAVTVFEDSGNGTKATAPFQLSAGDHELTYEASASESSCSFGFSLRATDDRFTSTVGNNGAYVYANASPYRNTTWFSVPTAGRFYLDVSGDCTWTASLASAPSPLDGADTIAFTGTGLGMSPGFTLTGGDHVVRYHLTSPRSEETCDVSASGIVDPTSPYNDLGGDIGLTMDPASELDGETYVYGIEPGRYQYQVGYAWCQFGVAEPVAWDITIEPIR